MKEGLEGLLVASTVPGFSTHTPVVTAAHLDPSHRCRQRFSPKLLLQKRDGKKLGPFVDISGKVQQVHVRKLQPCSFPTGTEAAFVF